MRLTCISVNKFVPNSTQVTFNQNGTLSGGNVHPRVDDNAQDRSLDEPWVSPGPYKFTRFTYSAFSATDPSADYDVNIYKNGVVGTIVSMVGSALQASFAVDIDVVEGDEIHLQTVQNDADTIDDVFYELA